MSSNSSTDRLAKHGIALDRAAEIRPQRHGVLLDDLPRAEATARSMSEQLQVAGNGRSQHAADFAEQVNALTRAGRERPKPWSPKRRERAAGCTLPTSKSSDRSCGGRITNAKCRMPTTDGRADAARCRGARANPRRHRHAGRRRRLLVEQASAGIGRTGVEAAKSLGSNVCKPPASRSTALTARIAEQERASQRIVAETARALADAGRTIRPAGRATAISARPQFANRSDAGAASFSTFAGNRSTGQRRRRRWPSGRRRCANRSSNCRPTCASSCRRRSAMPRPAPDRSSARPRSARPEIEWMRQARSKPATGSRPAQRASRSSRTGWRTCWRRSTKASAAPSERLAELAVAMRKRQSRGVAAIGRDRARAGRRLWSRSRKPRPMPPSAPARRSPAIVPESAGELVRGDPRGAGERRPRGCRGTLGEVETRRRPRAWKPRAAHPSG